MASAHRLVRQSCAKKHNPFLWYEFPNSETSWNYRGARSTGSSSCTGRGRWYVFSDLRKISKRFAKCQCPTMGLFLFRKPGTRTHTCTAAYLDRYPTHLVRVLRTLVSWCERVCLPGVLFIVIRRSRHGRVVRWALGPGPRESVARPAHGGCARQRAWTQ